MKSDRHLTPKQEKALAHFLKNGDKTAAYRHAYDCSRMAPSTINRRATELFAVSTMAARVEGHRAAAAERVTMEVADVLRDWCLLAMADPNEIVQHRRSCCRYCYGIDHYYQWSETEYAVEVARSIDSQLPTPDGSGGFGFDAKLDPHPECPTCHGEGVPIVHIADTRKLKGAARLLYAGVKQTKNGVEVLLHDQARARENIAKFLGMLRNDVTVKATLAGVMQYAELTPAQVQEELAKRGLPSTVFH